MRFSSRTRLTLWSIAFWLIATALWFRFGPEDESGGRKFVPQSVQAILARTPLMPEAPASTQTAESSAEPPPTPPAFPYANSPIMAEEVVGPDVDGNVFHITIRKTEFKYPFVRVVERKKGTDQGPVTQRLVMVADHVLVQKNPEFSEIDFQAAVKQAGGDILRAVNDQGLYMISFDGRAPQALDRFLKDLKQIAKNGVVAEPDYLRFIR